MKVLLINPPQTFYPGSEQPAGNLPIGLMYIAAVLEKAGLKVEILDAFISATFQEDGETVTVGLPFEQIKQNTTDGWDSLGHLKLILAIEEKTNISKSLFIRNSRVY